MLFLMRTFSFLVFCLSLVAIRLSAAEPAQPPAAPQQAEAHDSPAPAAGQAIGPCELITREEIAKIQGEAVTATSPSVRTEGSFVVSQCYVGLTTSSNSVVINVTRAASGTDAHDPREFWQRTFHKEKAGELEREKGKREKEENEKAPPKKVEGLGDEAFWTGDAKAGALYVLSGDVFLRISLGGASDQETKINRARQFAEIALKRL
jgi:hypothetical protein